MKIRQITLFLLFTLSAFDLQATAEIFPTEEERSASNLITFVMTFTYDNAGNTTMIKCFRQIYGLNSQETDEERLQSLVEDYEVSISADDSWEKVVVNVTGRDVKPVMSIYNLAGVRCFSEKMEGISMTFNLSSLKKGIYLFQFSTGDNTKTYKLIKHN